MISHILPVLGKMDALLFRVPLLGNASVRGKARAVAALSFYMPVLGGKRCKTVAELREGWLGFLGRFGLHPTILEETDSEFSWSMDACPYGFDSAEQAGVCDACMDLDRLYTRLLGGRLEILETIPGGSDQCRYITHLRRG